MSEARLQVARARMVDLVPLDALIEETRLWVQEHWPTQWRTPFHHEWLEELIKREEIFTVHLGDELIGAFRLLAADPDLWTDGDLADAYYVHLLIVRRSWAGQGLGARILRWVEAYTMAHGRRVVRLDTYFENKALVRFYQNLGFRPMSTRGENEVRVLLMEKAITPLFPPPQ